MKKIKLHMILIPATIVLAIVLFFVWLFRPQSAADLLDYDLGRSTEFQIINHKTGGNSGLIEDPDHALYDILEEVEVSFRRPYRAIYSQVGEPHYMIYLCQNTGEELHEIGELIFQASGYMYTEVYRYKVLSEEPFQELVALCGELVVEPADHEFAPIDD